ncbi:MAG TPA: hypothetical protein VM328_07010 [Fimbriimonadaceae bacterium]|nr:hypothetical protein [Fimbriimonadaceae bacterium]
MKPYRNEGDKVSTESWELHRTLARLGEQETIWAAVDVLRRWIETYGVPLALYTDWKNVYVREANAEEQGTGAVP